MKKKDKKKLLITGGHLTPAIAVIEKLNKDEWEVIFMGRRVAQEGTSKLAAEMQEIPKIKAQLVTIPAGKIPRHLDFRSVPAILRIPFGFICAFVKIARLKPDVILSFGGYVAVPAALAGKILKIPIITHEQTVKKGLANSLIEHFADTVAVSWEQTKKYFKKEVVVTGNPLRQEILVGPGQKIAIEKKDIPLLYITGGSQGAHIINKLVEKCLLKLLKSYAIVHQSGTTREGRDYQKLLKLRESLTQELKDRYLVRDWFTANEVSWFLRNADLVISRAGANTVTEIAFTGATALLIPLPIAGRREQLENARLLESVGTAEILSQTKLSEKLFRQKIRKMLANSARYKTNAQKAQALVDPRAAERLIYLVNEVYEKKKKKKSDI
jgi:UDP-N-acetylglucosamine--N-acetylmuramyl-(pentapeptide) pyrophosphoryl-undecaprenol N-acetylglucosamine transferase